MSLCLFGFKNSGKTYFGRLLSQKARIPFLDTDDLIQEHHQKSPAKFHQELGEDSFRRFESNLICQLFPATPTVISLGGGAVLNPVNVMHLQTLGKLIYLKVSYNTAKQRGLPPFLSVQTYEERLVIYENIPARTIDVDRLTEAEILEQLIRGF